MLKFKPPRMMCRWLSINPGRTRRPLRSTMRVLEPARAITAWSWPTAVKTPSPIATALAMGFARSSVVKRPLRRIRSALMWNFLLLQVKAWVRRKFTEDMRCAVGSHPGHIDAMSGQPALGQRYYLLAQQDAEQTDQRDHRWSRRANADASVEDADHHAGYQSDPVHAHRHLGRDACFAGVSARHDGLGVNQA